MIAELDTVVLARDIDAHGLKRGDIGAVVHRYTGGTAFEVEFVTGEGETVAVLTLTADDIRPIGRQEILHGREVIAALDHCRGQAARRILGGSANSEVFLHLLLQPTAFWGSH